MKKNWKLLLVVLLAGLTTAAILVLRNGDLSEAKGDAPKFKEFTIKKGTFEIVVSASGEVKPIDRIEIKSKASGVVEELPVEVGDTIRKGDLIARLDQKDERAALEQARADYDIAKAELKQAQHNFDRRNQLFEKGLISEEERDQIVLGLAVAKGKLIQAKTALERAEERFAESIVRAPIDGIILQKYVEEGQIIASGVSNVGGGTPIVDLADMSSVHIEAGIDEIDIGKVRVGQEAVVIAEAYPNLRFRGRIVRIAPEARIEQNVTLFDVIIEVENRDGKLKSGMNADVEITIVREEDVLLVPTIALQMPRGRGAKRNVRMVQLKDGDRFKPTKIEIGRSNFKEAIVLSGLQEGDIVGVPMTSRLKAANERLERMIRSSRSFGASGNSNRSRRR